jgi:hypothetical protein
VCSNSSVSDHCLGVGEDCAANLIGTDAEFDRDREPVVGDLQPTSRGSPSVSDCFHDRWTRQFPDGADVSVDAGPHA